MPHIDLNCDLGESFGAYTIGMDEKVIPFITSANVACGFHAGDPLVMQRTVALCKQSGAVVGAHPGFPDLQGFGRRQMKLTPAEAKAKIEEQRKEFDHIATPANLEEQALKLCGKDIYHRLIKGYTEKQWGRSAKELPAFIIKRIPFRFIYDNNYFNDSYQGIPKGGYNALIDALLEGTEVRLNTNYFSNRNELDALADNILFTGCIDQFFDYQCGHLEYRSLRFEHKQLETEDFQGNAVVNYTEREVPYTRIIEHKHFEFGTQPTTVITYEYPDDFAPGKEPYYPINDKRNTEMMSQYKKLASERKDVLFGGRLAQYAYADMDDTVAAALALCKKTFK